MNKRQYETTFIVDAHLPGEQIDAAVDRYTAFIDKNGGKVHNIDRWGKRRLAYEIAKKQYGYYVNVRFESEGSFIIELEKTYKLDDTIIRYLTTLVPPAALKEERENAQKEAVEADKPEKKAEQPEKPEEKPADKAAKAGGTESDEPAAEKSADHKTGDADTKTGEEKPSE